jgi:hydroxyacylglutathione hydrolase
MLTPNKLFFKQLEMSLKIIPIRAGTAQVFLVIQENNFFLVDAGGRGYASKVAKVITSHGFKLSDLKFIFLTHTHYDHAGCAAELRKMSGTKIIVHENEADFLRNGDQFIPAGTNLFAKIISGVGRLLGKTYSSYPPVEPDILFKDTFSLEPLGFNAKIISTPGHTIGSSSLSIDNVVFAGDTLFNIQGKIFPPFANDTTLLLKSWELLLNENAERYYPAHGKRLLKETLLDEFQKRKKR